MAMLIYSGGRAIPKIDTAPELWMLTSSGESAYLAAYFGMALSFAQFINPLGGPEAIRAYRERFRPSKQWQHPYAAVGIFAFCADTEEKANEVRAMMDYRLISFERGRFDEAPAPDKVKNEVYSAVEMPRIEFNRGHYVVGTPPQVKQQLTALAAGFDVECERHISFDQKIFSVSTAFRCTTSDLIFSCFIASISSTSAICSSSFSSSTLNSSSLITSSTQ